jgi:hypothetical protein
MEGRDARPLLETQALALEEAGSWLIFKADLYSRSERARFENGMQQRLSRREIRGDTVSTHEIKVINLMPNVLTMLGLGA